MPACAPSRSPAHRPRRRAVRVLAAARFASSGGTQAAQVALAYTVFEQTGSAAWVSASLVASAGVAGLMGPVSGRMSDRLDRRRVMVGSELAGALGWLLVLFARSPAMLVLAALMATAANAPFKAAANASVPNLVEAEHLPWANGTIATALNASMVVGPLAAGALLGIVGPNAVFGLNVVTFVVSARLLARLPGTLAEARPPSTDVATATWRAVLADRRRRLLVAVTALSFAAFGVILVADLPLVDHLGGGSVGYALLTTLWGIGAVFGSWAAARLPEHLETRALALGTTAMALSVSSLTVLPNLASVIVVGAVGGLGSGIVFPPWFSLLQRSTSDAERGTTFARRRDLRADVVPGRHDDGRRPGRLGRPSCRPTWCRAPSSSSRRPWPGRPTHAAGSATSGPASATDRTVPA